VAIGEPGQPAVRLWGGGGGVAPGGVEEGKYGKDRREGERIEEAEEIEWA
jgi:hypothetical protein